MTDTTCSTKRKFHSEAAALSFEQEFRRNNPSAEQQRPFECEECPSGTWHLTYRDVGDHTIAQTRYDNIYAVGNGRRTQEEQVQLREDILHLKAAGKKNKEIAAELGVSLGTVHFYGGPTPPKTNRKNPSLDEMNAEKERLEQRLVVLQAQIKTQADKITAQIEFQRLKVQWVDVDGERCVMVKKELNVLTLVPEDAAQLQELLEALFTSPAAETAA